MRFEKENSAELKAVVGNIDQRYAAQDFGTNYVPAAEVSAAPSTPKQTRGFDFN